MFALVYVEELCPPLGTDWQFEGLVGKFPLEELVLGVEVLVGVVLAEHWGGCYKSIDGWMGDQVVTG